MSIIKKPSADSETLFLSGLIELQYGKNVEKELQQYSKNVLWAKGWPLDDKAFWNAEAFMWSRKISKEKRDLIKNELAFLAQGKNIDLGCGAYSYVKSIGFDFSSKMLEFNDNLVKKVQGDLEQKLPFAAGESDSVTMVFVLNYVHNYLVLLSEIKRVLNKEGVLMVVLFSKQINNWQKQKELNHYSFSEWKRVLISSGFAVDFCVKEELWFFKCSKSLV